MGVRLDRIGQKRIELRPRHLQLLRMRIDIFSKSLKFSRRPTTFKFGAVLAFTIQLEVVVIHQVGELCLADCGFGNNRWDEDDPVRLG